MSWSNDYKQFMERLTNRIIIDSKGVHIDTAESELYCRFWNKTLADRTDGVSFNKSEPVYVQSCSPSRSELLEDMRSKYKSSFDDTVNRINAKLGCPSQFMFGVIWTDFVLSGLFKEESLEYITHYIRSNMDILEVGLVTLLLMTDQRYLLNFNLSCDELGDLFVVIDSSTKESLIDRLKSTSAFKFYKYFSLSIYDALIENTKYDELW